jgi:hypothetical protein
MIMKLKHLAVLTILAASMAGIAAKADTVTLDAFGGVYPGIGGGEFTAYTSTSYLGNYASAAKYAGGFETFCIETRVDFTPGNWGGPTYYYTLGSVSQPLSPPNSPSGSGWPLSTGAAYLYYEFGNGALAGFDYTWGAGRQAEDNLLQAAIWAFQGGQTYGSYPNGGAGNIYYDEAVTALGGVNNATNSYAGNQVQVLSLWVNSDDTGAAQNQLVLTGGSGPFPHPTPDGGMTIMLLGGALAGLRAMRRKLFN